ncbi:MAG: hypothetical protein M0C28_41920 [Candidatus Moduliflexus flocculans]|nr:hypothetical protein [Candidatus Moduliflexus flocculans]
MKFGVKTALRASVIIFLVLAFSGPFAASAVPRLAAPAAPDLIGHLKLALDRPGQHGRPHLRLRGPRRRLHPGPRWPRPPAASSSR